MSDARKEKHRGSPAVLNAGSAAFNAENAENAGNAGNAKRAVSRSLVAPNPLLNGLAALPIRVPFHGIMDIAASAMELHEH
jgi:hypothetical protein